MKLYLSLGKIAQIIDAQLQGDPEQIVERLWPLPDALSSDISFFYSQKYRRYLKQCQAAALIVDMQSQVNHRNLLRVADPHLAFNRLVTFCADKNPDIPPQIDPSAQIDAGAHIYPNVYIGKNVHIKAGAVIGSLGFGFTKQNHKWRRVPQVGCVVIEDDVEIGANTCIDRARIGETRIRRGTKIDNLVQIGHGAHIGEDSLICACTGIAGSTRIGNRVVIGGACGIADNLFIDDDVILVARTAVFQNIEQPGVYSGRGAILHRDELKCMAIYRKLPSLMSHNKHSSGQ